MKMRLFILFIFLLNFIQLQAQCPDPSSLDTSYVGPSSAILSWTTGGATNWQIQYDTVGFNLGSGKILETSTNPLTITNLLPETSYEFYVRDSCGIGDVSNWVGPFTFTTIEFFNEQTEISLPGTSGSLAWGDYDNDGYLDILLTGESSEGLISKIFRNNSGIDFSEQTSIALTGVSASSVAWGDYDNDGYLDILLTGLRSGGFSKIYKNNGDNSFSEQIDISLPAVGNSSVAWGDYDSDGDLDILLTGEDRIAKIYKNNGNNNFVEQNGIFLTGVESSSVVWGDYDNDGDLDILLTGRSHTEGIISKIYKNNGDNSFTEQPDIEIQGFSEGSVDWGDYDQDGYLDILSTGDTLYASPCSKIYRNNGNNGFVEQTEAGLLEVWRSSSKWGDYDNDGDLDILISGDNLENGTRIYKNNGNNSFTSQSKISLIGLMSTSSSWGDYDNDGDLDILINGLDANNNRITKIYKNNSKITNTIPECPENIQASVSGNNVTFSWDNSSDNETLQSALSYNLQIDTISKGVGIVSPMAQIPGGFRKIVQRGLIQDTVWTIKNLIPGTYYWRVQAIDQSFTGSPFSTEESFTITFSNSILPIDKQSLLPEIDGIALSVMDTETADSWQWKYSSFTGGPYNKLILGATGNTFVPNFSDFGNYFVVCVSTKDGVSVRSNEVKIDVPQFTALDSFPLPNLTESSVAWGDYDNDNDLDILISGLDEFGERITKVYKNNAPDSLGFHENTGIVLTGIINGSVAWGDYDNDGFLDILLTGECSEEAVTKIYRNNGDDSFAEQTDLTLIGLKYSCAAWGDYDHDGDLDVILSGETESGDQLCKIYRNDNQNQFVDINFNIVPFSIGSIAWGDYDKDNDLDILISGRDFSGNAITKIYKNNGFPGFGFTDINAKLKGVINGDVKWGDYDNDGDLDIAITGNTEPYYSGIYRNNGNDSFTEQTDINLYDFSEGLVSWGDYDNDGDLDIFLSGFSWSIGSLSKIYNNTISDSLGFTEQTSISLTGIDNGSFAWGDYDNDGDLDLILTGINRNSIVGQAFTKVYLNNATSPNSLPVAPVNLSSSINASRAVLNWNKSTDNETPVDGLSYNIVVSKSKDSVEIISPMADLNTGYRRISTMGNAFQDTTFTINNLDTGKYFWSVQAIDHCFAGSAFAEYDTFYIKPSFTEISTNLTAVCYSAAAWGDYDNDGYLDILLTGIYDSEENAVSKIYKNNGDNSFTEQTDIVLPGVSGAVAWGDYDNDNDLDILLTGHLDNSYSGIMISKIYKNNLPDSSGFTEQEHISLTGVDIGAVAWGDYDNDGDLDILLTGQNQVPIYKNNGNNSFTQQTGISFNGLFFLYSSVVWGDYDNDSDLDILVAGLTQNGIKSMIWKNNGDNSFSEQTDISLTGINKGSAAWGDYDNDGDLDVLLTGAGDNGRLTKIYRNDGNNIFTDINAIIRGISNGSAQWGDYDNDGDLDILLSGESGTFITVIYRNEGNGIFTEIDIGLPGCQNGSAEFGDCDNDGDLDILLTGAKNEYSQNAISKIYQNNGNWENSKPTSPTNLQAEKYAYGVLLKWGTSTDDQTPANALSYNIRIGTSIGGSNILSPMSNIINGDLAIPKMGNCNLNKQWHLDTLPEGKYYWSVQAIDQTFLGGEWAVEDSFTITVIHADFITDTVCLGVETSFTDESLTSSDSIIEWKWDFGDDSTSTMQNPVHLYAIADTFFVKLVTISSQYSDTIIKEVIVKPKPIANFHVDAVCHGEPSVFVNQTDEQGLSITSWNWEFGDNQTSSLNTPDPHYYAQSGEYIAKLTVNSDNACFDTISQPVIAAKYPVIIVSANGPLEFCDGKNVILSVENVTNYIYQWKLDDIPISDSVNYYYNAIYSGAYSVDVENTLAGCLSSSISVNVSVEPVPTEPIISYSGKTEFCQGDSVVLSASYNDDYTYQWKQNGFPSGITSHEYVAKISGSYTVEVVNNSGCIAVSFNSVNVMVNEMPDKPIVNTTGYNIADCPQEKIITLSIDQATVQYNYQWQRNGIPMDGVTESILEDYLKEGDYSVIADNNGCSNESDIVGIYYNPELPEKPEIIAAGPNVWYLACTNDTALQYEWYYNNEILSGANDYLYVANQTMGTYSVKIAEENGCFVSSDAVTIPLTATGIDDANPFANLKIYPNPTPGVFTIEMDNQLYGELLIYIYAQDGKEVFNIKFHKNTQHFKAQVDLSAQGSGLYIILLSLDNYKTEKNIIIE